MRNWNKRILTSDIGTGPQMCPSQNSKIWFVHHRTQYKFIFFFHIIPKLYRNILLKSVQYGTGPHVKIFYQKKKKDFKIIS